MVPPPEIPHPFESEEDREGSATATDSHFAGREQGSLIGDKLSELRSLDQDLDRLHHSEAERTSKLNALRAQIGAEGSGATSPLMEVDQDRIEEFEHRRQKLTTDIKQWIDVNGRENLPAGFVVETTDGWLETKGASTDRKSRLPGKFENLEARRAWVRAFEDEMIRSSEQVLREDRRTKNASNLDGVVRLLKRRIPEVTTKKTKDFLQGQVPDLPFDIAYLQWKTSASRLKSALGKTNQITSLELVFDHESEVIGTTTELAQNDASMKEVERPGAA